MKKLLLTFSLIGLFALSGSINANANMEDPSEGLDPDFPCTLNVCGNYCFCYDGDDLFYWISLYCVY